MCEWKILTFLLAALCAFLIGYVLYQDTTNTSKQEKKQLKQKKRDYLAYIKDNTKDLIPGSFFEIGPLPSYLAYFDNEKQKLHYSDEAQKLIKDCVKEGLSVMTHLATTKKEVAMTVYVVREKIMESIVEQVSVVVKRNPRAGVVTLRLALNPEIIDTLRTALTVKGFTLFSVKSTSDIMILVILTY